MTTRVCKTFLVAVAGLYLGLITVNNLIDYDSNYEFVRHVLSMDNTFPDNRLMGRAINSPFVHHVLYLIVIVWEGLAALLCWIGTFFLIKNIRSDRKEFNRSKSVATIGLSLSLVLWLFGFLVVGGEWFLMWQSSKWNAQNAATRMFLIGGLLLLFLNQPDEN
ncbi:MAG: DUF2165 family protein [Nitrospiria bacterium]